MKRWARRWAWRAGGLLLAWVLLVNLGVRELGHGDLFLLDPRFMPEKSTALLRLGLHLARHPLRPEEPDPEPLLRRTAHRERLPAGLALAVGRAESGLRPHCISHAGAMGLMQLMPATAAELGVSDPFDGRQSIAGGVAYLASLWARYGGDRRRVIAAYNAGPGAVPRRGALALSGETVAYVRQVMRYGGE